MPQGIAIKSLDDLTPAGSNPQTQEIPSYLNLDAIPGFSAQAQRPGMQINPVTPPTMPVVDVDMEQPTPAYDPNELLGNLKAVSRAQQEYFNTLQSATTKNTVVQQEVYKETVLQQDKVLEAFDKLQRIDRNPLAELFALFDPATWSKEQQLIEIEKANLRSQQTTLRGQAQMNINNADPAISKIGVELAEQSFQLGKDFVGVLQADATLTNTQMETRLKAINTRIALSEEVRKELDLRAKSLTIQQKKQILKDVKAGRGDPFWQGKEGILEEDISRSEHLQLQAEQIKLNMQKGRFELAEAQTDAFVKNIPFDLGTALVEDALNRNLAIVDVGGVKVPLGRLINGVESSRKDTEALVNFAVGQQAGVINQKMQALVRQNSALTLTSNTQASTRVQDIARLIGNPALLQPGQEEAFSQAVGRLTPTQIQKLNASMDYLQKQTDADVKAAAANYKDPNAKAAFESFMQNGVVPSASAHYLVEDALTDPSVATKAKFGPAFSALRVEVAKRIRDLNMTGAPGADLEGTDAQTQAASLLSWAFRRNNVQIKDIVAEVVQSGFGNEEVTRNVTTSFRTDAMRNVIDGLSTAPGPNSAIFLQLLKNPTEWRGDDKGSGDTVDARKLSNYLLQQSVLTGGKADYFQTFLDALSAYSTSADSITADPKMTVPDHALLSQTYGDNPRSQVLSEFRQDMAIQGQILRRALEEAVKQDVTGETQRRALMQFPDINAEPDMRQQFNQAVPSATGIGNAEDIKRIYGTDPRFGNTPTGVR